MFVIGIGAVGFLVCCGCCEGAFVAGALCQVLTCAPASEPIRSTHEVSAAATRFVDREHLVGACDLEVLLNLFQREDVGDAVLEMPHRLREPGEITD